MRKSAVTVISILLCTAFLASCGDSDSSSSSSSSATTATVPAGKLGAAAQSCPAPRFAGVTVLSFTATNVSCDVATNGFTSVFRTNRFAGWDCRQTISGRNVRSTCTNTADPSQVFAGSWQVA
jgi:hypothetical protein